MFLDFARPGELVKVCRIGALHQHDVAVLDLEARRGRVGEGRILAQIHQQLLGQSVETMISSLLQISCSSIWSPVTFGRPQLAGAQLARDIVGDVGHHFLAGKRDAAFKDGEDEKRERQWPACANSIAVLPRRSRTKRLKDLRARHLAMPCRMPNSLLIPSSCRSPCGSGRSISANQLRSGLDDR